MSAIRVFVGYSIAFAKNIVSSSNKTLFKLFRSLYLDVYLMYIYIYMIYTYNHIYIA